MNSLVRTSEQPVIEITNIEETCGTIKTMLESVGLPSECMFAPTKERFRVFLNFENITKLSKLIKPEDILTIRGNGRFKIKEILGNTKKGKIIVLIEKFV